MIHFQKEEYDDKNIQRWIRWMDAEVFPDDKPVTFPYGTHWWVGYHSNEPVCYAAWRPHYPMKTLSELHWHTPLGFLYRAGVLPIARGNGYQKELIRLREEDMIKRGVTKSVTYTEPVSIASMKSLIDCGYRPYETTEDTNLAGVGRAGLFVHWEKDLT